MGHRRTASHPTMPRGIALDISDKRLNAVPTFHIPEIF